MRFDPETGEIIPSRAQFDPETGLQVPAGSPKKELTYGEIILEAQKAAKRMHNISNHRLCGAGSCAFSWIGVPAAVLYVESGAFSNLNPYDPFYLGLTPSQKMVFNNSYKTEEKKLRRESVYTTQVGFLAVLFLLVLID